MRINAYVFRAILLSFDKDTSIRVKVDPDCQYRPSMLRTDPSRRHPDTFNEYMWGEANRVFILIKQANLFTKIGIDEFELTIHPSLADTITEISEEIAQIDFDNKDRNFFLTPQTKHTGMQATFISRVKGYLRSLY